MTSCVKMSQKSVISLCLSVGSLAAYVAEGSEVGVKVICFRCNNPRDKLRTCGLLMCDMLVV